MKKFLKAVVGCVVQIGWCVLLFASWFYFAKEFNEPSDHHQLKLGAIVLIQAIHVIFWRRIANMTNSWIGKSATTNAKREIKVEFSSKEIESLFLSNQHVLPDTIRAAIADGYHVDFAVEASAIRAKETLSHCNKTQPSNAVKN